MLTLAYGRSGQRIWCPHRGDVVPASTVSLVIYDDGGDGLATTTATKGALSTSLAVAVAQGVREIVVSPPTGATRNDWVAVVGDDGQAEVVKAVGVDSTAKSMTIAPQLDRGYSAGDLVKSASIYYDADLTETDTWVKGLYYQAVFSCSEWATSRVVVFRIVSDQTDNPITFEDVQRVLPAAGVYRGADTTAELDHHRDLAWRIICGRLLSLGHDPATLRDTEVFAEAGGILAAALMMQTRPGGVETARALAGDPCGSGGLFAEHWQSIVSSPMWFDADQNRKRRAAEMRTAQRLVRRGR